MLSTLPASKYCPASLSLDHGKWTPNPALLMTWNGKSIVSLRRLGIYPGLIRCASIQEATMASAWEIDSSMTSLAFLSENAGASSFWWARHSFPSCVTRLGPNLSWAASELFDWEKSGNLHIKENIGFNWFAEVPPTRSDFGNHFWITSAKDDAAGRDDHYRIRTQTSERFMV